EILREQVEDDERADQHQGPQQQFGGVEVFALIAKAFAHVAKHVVAIDRQQFEVRERAHAFCPPWCCVATASNDSRAAWAASCTAILRSVRARSKAWRTAAVLHWARARAASLRTRWSSSAKSSSMTGSSRGITPTDSATVSALSRRIRE